MINTKIEYCHDLANKVIVTKNKKQLIAVAYSDVCCHMKVSGSLMLVELLDDRLAQLYDLNNEAFSFPIHYSEAGIYLNHNTNEYYSYLPMIDL